MRFITALIIGAAVAVSAQTNHSTTTAQDECLKGCEPRDVNCRAKCVNTPFPDAGQIQATNNCYADCQQRNGTVQETSDCRTKCDNDHYMSGNGNTGSSPNNSGSGNTGSGSDNSGSGNSNTGSDSDNSDHGNHGSDSNSNANDNQSSNSPSSNTFKTADDSTATKTGDSSSPTKTGAAALVGAPGAILGLAVALLAL